MRNEKGVTLIELLATLAIAAFFVGTIFLVFSQVNLTWNSTTKNYNNESQARFAMDTIASNLADAKSIYYVEDTSNVKSDLRFQTAHYDINGNPETKEIHYENGTIQFGAISYTNFKNPNIIQPNGVILASNITKSELPSYSIVNQDKSKTNLNKIVDPSSMNHLIEVSILFDYSPTPMTEQVKYLDFN